jgi:hypothetical protein
MPGENSTQKTFRDEEKVLKTYHAYIRAFDPPNGPGYVLTGKSSFGELTREDIKYLATEIKGFSHAIVAILDLDDPAKTKKITPKSMSPAELQRYIIALDVQERPASAAFLGLSSEEAKAETAETFYVNDKAVSLKPSEFSALVSGKAGLATPEELSPVERKAYEEELKGYSDVAMVALGFSVGAIPKFNKNITPDTEVPITINVGATREGIQKWYCDSIDKPFETEGFAKEADGKIMDKKTAFSLGFIQARMDAKKDFELGDNIKLGLFGDCPDKDHATEAAGKTPITHDKDAGGSTTPPSHLVRPVDKGNSK